MAGWIGVDLDGTLATYDGWHGPEHIGAPIYPMVRRVTEWLAAGQDVRIFTARASVPECVDPVQQWCQKHIGKVLPVTNIKDFEMTELWDDRAVRVKTNEGEPCCSAWVPARPGAFAR